MKATASSSTIPADIRQVIVRQFGAALAAAWRSEYDQENERPVRLELATGRDVHEGGVREQHEDYHST